MKTQNVEVFFLYPLKKKHHYLAFIVTSEDRGLLSSRDHENLYKTSPHEQKAQSVKLYLTG